MKKTTTRSEIREVTVPVEEETFTCDRCGGDCTDDIDVNEEQGVPWVTQLEIRANPDSCVNMRVFRQFCEECSVIVESAILQAIGVRSSAERATLDEPDIYYGSYMPAHLAGEFPPTYGSRETE